MSNEDLPDSTQPYFTNNWFDITAKPIWDRLIPRLNLTKILEIGSYEGASSCYLITNCASKAPIEIHCIDTWEGSDEDERLGVDMSIVERRFLANTKAACSKALHPVNLVAHKGQSNICLAKLLAVGPLGCFDLIYIDGSHHAPDVLSDAVLSFLLLKVGGTMIFDDYLWRNPAVSADSLDNPKPAIDSFMNIYFHEMRLELSQTSQVVAHKISN
jgi:hypothetical protein